MAYTDLVSSGQAFVGGNAGATYNFAVDTPVANDNPASPHITHMGIQIAYDAGAGNDFAPINGLSNIITNLRVKVGSTIIIDWNDPSAKPANTAISALATLIQRIGGQDYCVPDDASGVTGVAMLSWPVGISAATSHRVNVSVTLAPEGPGGGAGMGSLGLTAASELSLSLNYGLSRERTVIGSRQDWTVTAGATRTITAYGKEGFNMLGLFLAGDDNAVDRISQARVANGAFRELAAMEWRGLNNSWANPDFTGLRNGGINDYPATGILAIPAQQGGQGGSLFLNLRRISAGANMDVAITTPANGTVSAFPVWVAPISAKSGPPRRQTVQQPQSTTANVEDNTQG